MKQKVRFFSAFASREVVVVCVFKVNYVVLTRKLLKIMVRSGPSVFHQISINNIFNNLTPDSVPPVFC